MPLVALPTRRKDELIGRCTRGDDENKTKRPGSRISPPKLTRKRVLQTRLALLTRESAMDWTVEMILLMNLVRSPCWSSQSIKGSLDRHLSENRVALAVADHHEIHASESWPKPPLASSR